MPRISRPDWTPKYGRHKSQARVAIPGRGMIWLPGEYGSVESRRAYDRAIAEWIASGRPGVLGALQPREAATEPQSAPEFMPVSKVAVMFMRHAKVYYRLPDGSESSALWKFKRAIAHLVALYADLPAREFGPLALTAVRNRMVDRDLARTTVNHYIATIKQIFKWAAANELVPAAVYHGLATLQGLRPGRSDARESEPIKPVPDAHIEAVLPLLTRPVRAMVQLQRMTGARPGEVCAMRVGEIDTAGTVWLYLPRRHKTQHLGRSRQIAIGPRAQGIIGPFLKRGLSEYLFNPQDAITERRTVPDEQKSPARLRRDRRAEARRGENYRDHYSVSVYANAIARACQKAGVPEWSPNQLRHAKATEVRREFGVDVAAAVLGHARTSTTELYAERAVETLRQVAIATG